MNRYRITDFSNLRESISPSSWMHAPALSREPTRYSLQLDECMKGLTIVQSKALEIHGRNPIQSDGNPWRNPIQVLEIHGRHPQFMLAGGKSGMWYVSLSLAIGRRRRRSAKSGSRSELSGQCRTWCASSSHVSHSSMNETRKLENTH
jgi:hypothetical protein